jgi:hypothetical protein
VIPEIAIVLELLVLVMVLFATELPPVVVVLLGATGAATLVGAVGLAAFSLAILGTLSASLSVLSPLEPASLRV